MYYNFGSSIFASTIHFTHYKPWHPNKALNATFWRAVRGDLYLLRLAMTLDFAMQSNYDNCYRRVAHILRPRDNFISVQSGGCARGSATHFPMHAQKYKCKYRRTFRHTETKRSVNSTPMLAYIGDIYVQTHLPSHLWIVFAVLLIGVSPKVCSGAKTGAYITTPSQSRT